MEIFPVAVGALGVFVGLALVRTVLVKPAIDPAAVLAQLDGAESQLDEYSERMSQRFAPRVLRPIASRLTGMMKGVLPGNYVERLQHKIVLAGKSDRIGAEDVVAMQAIASGLALLVTIGFSTLRGWTPAGGLKLFVALTAAALFLPGLYLTNMKQKRQEAIRKDMPDVLDLMAISVEAGVGLEGAIDVVRSHFDSPLAHELNRMLREMELGLSRRAALGNLKRRCETPEVSNFVLALIQADALGMPMSKVLRVQADEGRAKRRQWAREKAAKLPVKILFPMFLFIFPALFVVVLGPAVMSIAHNVLGK